MKNRIVAVISDPVTINEGFYSDHMSVRCFYSSTLTMSHSFRTSVEVERASSTVDFQVGQAMSILKPAGKKIKASLPSFKQVAVGIW